MDDQLNNTADYLFIGLGAANCLLLLNLHEHGLLSGKTIAIIEPNHHHLDERNFCFWATDEELSTLNLRALISSDWERIQVAGRGPQSISPLHYFHIKGRDLFAQVMEILKGQHVQFYTETFVGGPLMESTSFMIQLGNTRIMADQVYDSRAPKYAAMEAHQSHIWQSFYGWTVKTNDYTFDRSTIVMMDFDIPQNHFCQFMYILPFSEETALFEITRFGKEKISKAEATILLNEYLARYGFSYQILEEEKGVIPMSSASISNPDYGPKWVYTGASANMIKPTTGYAFHNMAIDAQNNVNSILAQQPPQRQAGSARFKFYDRLLLKILEEKPQFGKQIFQYLFDRMPIQTVLNFLSERSIFSQELLIFSKLPIFIFLIAALKDIAHTLSNISAPLLALAATSLMLVLSFFGYEQILYVGLIAGFLTIGLSHGAVDHLVNDINSGYKQLLVFSLKYMAKGALLGLLWLILPDLALAVFLMFSAWHFGQADFQEWHFQHDVPAFVWGAIILSIILFFHLEETILVLENIDGLQVHRALAEMTASQLWMGQMAIIFCALLMAAIHQSKQMLLTACYLLLSSTLPLIVSFGIYFVLQHSLNGWRHLKSGLNINSYQLWLKSLPFSTGGALIIATFLLANHADYLSLFFILLSCMSLPHILSMHRFYFRLHSLKN